MAALTHFLPLLSQVSPPPGGQAGAVLSPAGRYCPPQLGNSSVGTAGECGWENSAVALDFKERRLKGEDTAEALTLSCDWHRRIRGPPGACREKGASTWRTQQLALCECQAHVRPRARPSRTAGHGRRGQLTRVSPCAAARALPASRQPRTQCFPTTPAGLAPWPHVRAGPAGCTRPPGISSGLPGAV